MSDLLDNVTSRLKKNKAIFLPAAVIVVILILVLSVVFKDQIKKAIEQKKVTPTTPTPTPYVKTTWNILVSRAGFVPRVLEVPSNGEIVFVNLSPSTIDIQSEDVPPNPKLNLGNVESGQSVSLRIETRGSYKYKNTLKPAQGGEIIVR